MYILSVGKQDYGLLEQGLSRVAFKISVGFVVGVLILLAVSLSISAYYLAQQQRLATSGDVDGALDAARLSARLDPFNSAPLTAEALLLQRQGQNEEAAEVLRDAIERDPANYSNRTQLGNLQLTQLNDPEAAVESYRRALEQIPRDTNLIASLAFALTRTGDLEAAKTEYERVQEFDRISSRNLYDLGRIYARTGEPEKAVETLTRAREDVAARVEDSNNELKRVQRELFLNSIDLAVADAHVVQGDYDAARAVLEESEAEQAPAILELLNTNPEEYRDSVLNSGL